MVLDRYEVSAVSDIQILILVANYLDLPQIG